MTLARQAAPKTADTKAPKSESKLAAPAKSMAAPAWTDALGSQPLLTLQTKLLVNQPGDVYEQEADRMAAQVTRTASPVVQRQCACGGMAGADGECAACKANRLSLQRKGEGVTPSEAPPSVHETLRSSGQPLDGATRGTMEQHFGQDFGGVRVHTSPQAAQSAADVSAQAYTVGSNVVFGAGQYAPGTDSGNKLIAHELTHTVQQTSASPSVQRSFLDDLVDDGRKLVNDGKDAVGRGVSAVGEVISHPGDAIVSGAKAVGNAAINTGQAVVGGVKAVGQGIANAAAAGASLVGDALVAAIRLAAPGLMRLIDDIRAAGGIFNYLKRLISAKLKLVFNALGGDSKKSSLANLVATVQGMVESSDGIIAALKSGNCKPLFAAFSQLGDAIGRVAGDAWNGLVDFLRPVGDFFSKIWTDFGAPVVDWIKKQAGDLWKNLQSMAAEVWSWVQPVIRVGQSAWSWVKNQLGIGEGTEGQSGLLQWITGILSSIWEDIKTAVKPVLDPMKRMASHIIDMLPLKAIMDLRVKVTGWLKNMKNMTKNLAAEEDKPGIIENRETLRNEILPAIMKTIQGLRVSIIGAGHWVADKIGNLSTIVGNFMTNLRANGYLSVVANMVGWVETKVNDMVAWAQTKVTILFNKFGDGLVYLSHFIRPILDTLEKLISTLGNLVGKLPDLILGPLWKAIPACIRDPIKDFVINQILKNIPIFAQLMEIPNLWERLSQTAMRILRLVFVDGNLLKAAWTFFKEMLNLVGIPARFVVSILNKAATVFLDILENPVGFLKNLLASVKLGFSNFFSNIWKHLLNGVLDWLFGQVKGAGIERPADFSLGSIFKLVLQVLNISYENIMKKVEKKDKGIAEKIRTGVKWLGKAWHWISVLIEKGPTGLWEEIKEQIGNIKDMVISSVIGWIEGVIIKRVVMRLLSSLDPTGIGAVINSIITVYTAIQAAVAYINEMLQIVDNVLDGIGNIVKGAIAPAAKILEETLARAIPVAIGFLAYQVGLGTIGERIRETVENLRKKVDGAIDSLIDKGLKLIGGLLGKGEEKKDTEELGFDAEDEHHNLSVEGTEIMVASNNKHPVHPELIAFKNDARLKAVANEAPDETKQKADTVVAIDKAEKKVDVLHQQLKAGTLKKIDAWPSELSQHMGKVYLFFHGTKKATKIKFGSNGAAKWVTADPLTLKPDPDVTPSKDTTEMADEYNSLRKQEKKDYVRAHLIHFGLHGPNDKANFALALGTTNTAMSRQMENPALALLTQGKGKTSLRYKTTMTLIWRERSQARIRVPFAKHISVEASHIDDKGKVTNLTPFTATEPDPDP